MATDHTAETVTRSAVVQVRDELVKMEQACQDDAANAGSNEQRIAANALAIGYNFAANRLNAILGD